MVFLREKFLMTANLQHDIRWFFTFYISLVLNF